MSLADPCSFAFVRRLRQLAVIVLVAVSGWNAPAAEERSGAIDEYIVKAAFLYNFCKFIAWPGDAHPPSDRLVLGIANPAAFGTALKTLEGRRVGDQLVRVRVCRTVAEAKQCHLVFLNFEDRRRNERFLSMLHAEPVVTVGEQTWFLHQGGAICFFREGAKIRFAINREAIGSSGVGVSSQLLRLAQREPEETGGLR